MIEAERIHSVKDVIERGLFTNLADNPDLPFIPQLYGNWCGYAGLSMLLQHRGFPIKQQEIFFRSNPQEAKDLDLPLYSSHTTSGPIFSHLAAIAKDIVGDEYKVGLFHSGKDQDILTSKYLQEGVYSAYAKKGLTPHDILKTFLRADNPAMIRLMKHNVVIPGFGKGMYQIFNPLDFGPHFQPEGEIDQEWRSDDGMQYINEETVAVNGVLPVTSSKYLMLVIYPDPKLHAAKKI